MITRSPYKRHHLIEQVKETAKKKKKKKLTNEFKLK